MSEGKCKHSWNGYKTNSWKCEYCGKIDLHFCDEKPLESIDRQTECSWCKSVKVLYMEDKTSNRFARYCYNCDKLSIGIIDMKEKYLGAEKDDS